MEQAVQQIKTDVPAPVVEEVKLAPVVTSRELTMIVKQEIELLEK